MTILDSFLFLFIHYFGVRKLEGFFAFLILIMAFAFIGNMVNSNPDISEMIKGTLIPSVPEGSLNAALGVTGAVIMPSNLYLHSALVLTRKIDVRSKNKIHEANIYNNIESSLSLLMSFIISAAVISTFASYIIANPGVNDLTLLEASDALASTFGHSSKYIWAIGLLAAGQSSTMTGTYAG